MKKLVRRDAKDARGSDPDPTVDILDYNLGMRLTFKVIIKGRKLLCETDT